MRRGASSSSVTSGIGRAAKATKSSTASSRLLPRPCTFCFCAPAMRAKHASTVAFMAFEFPSHEWVAAYKDAINANAEYKKAGKDWTHGVVAMVVKAEPSVGIAEDQAMWLDVEQGTCRDCKLISAK